jgi:hypothetical protein
MIIQKSTISIARDQKSVFNYIADLGNDSQWRSEVRCTSREGRVKLGNIAHEESFLSKKIPSYVRKLTCCSYVSDTLVVYQTAPEDPHSLRSTRSVRSTGLGHTEFTYLLEFDPSVVKLAMGFPLPRFLIKMVTRRAMKSYLKKLRTILQEQDVR